MCTCEHLRCPPFRLLLHTETHDGSVIPIWDEVDSENVSVLKDIMASRKGAGDGVELKYSRVPITAERPPDFSDLTDLIDVAMRNPNAPIVINCQLGRGRSTMTAVCSPFPCYKTGHNGAVSRSSLYSLGNGWRTQTGLPYPLLLA